jgi:hypothetical protein
MDVVEAGREREPLARGWLLAGAAVLLVLAAAGTARTLGEPGRRALARARPRPTVSVPPLETVPVHREGVGNLTAARGAIAAPAIDPADAPDLLLADQYHVLRVHTANDATRTLLRAPEGMGRNGFVPLRDGFATMIVPESDAPIDPVLHVRHGTRTTNVALRGPARVAPGATDTELWVAYDGGQTVQRYDAMGRPAGPRIALPRGTTLVRGTVAGLLLGPVDDSVRLRVWDPATRRFVRDLPPKGYQVAAGRRMLVWSTYCGKPACPVRVTDLATGAVRAVPVPPGEHEEVNGRLNPDETAIAYVWAPPDGGSDGAVYVSRFGDSRPRRVVDESGSIAALSWATDEQLVLVQGLAEQLEEQLVVFAWDRSRGLRQAGVYAIGFAWEIDARPRSDRGSA